MCQLRSQEMSLLLIVDRARSNRCVVRRRSREETTLFHKLRVSTSKRALIYYSILHLFLYGSRSSCAASSFRFSDYATGLCEERVVAPIARVVAVLSSVATRDVAAKTRLNFAGTVGNCRFSFFASIYVLSDSARLGENRRDSSA
ncbi:PREDICTED: uncharacterized protein LOC108760621 [Trachymyrmex cornetzi]|uniref:uncharacterized protein LOC108760621 n=1 Tax=Trachymyrmex cornetzi TaxID=471704 RepID=UPI00084F745D|nr:PREDICTED: uncharacterized protein LOC108760621 [Trachymyrmex cornetzi]